MEFWLASPTLRSNGSNNSQFSLGGFMASHRQEFSFYNSRCKPKTSQVVASGLWVGSEPCFKILGAHAVIPQLELPEGIKQDFCYKYIQNIGSVG